VTGPTPTSAERHAAAERLAQHPNRDVAAAVAMAARLGQLARTDLTGAPAYARELADLVARLAEAHAYCVRVGCVRCLYLVDARAVAAAWRDGPTP
jgi:hypothetical protein